MNRYKCSNTEALSKTRREQPELFAAYQRVAGGGVPYENPPPWEPAGNR